MTESNSGIRTNALIPIEHQNQRILLTEQLAQVYETDVKNIQMNYANNKDRFTEGIHYYLLQGDNLRAFKNDPNHIGLVGKNASCLYLWTERGASRHCKILDTSKAWEQFDNLEATYFRAKEQTLLDYQGLSPELRMFKQIFDSVARTELEQKRQAQAIVDMNRKLDDTCGIIALDPNDWRKQTQALITRISQKLGGIEHIRDVHQEAYKLVERRAGANLKRRLDNKRRRLAEEGVCKSRRDRLNQLDVIGDDKKLIDIYVHVVKQMAAKYQAIERKEAS